jgi:hypothetical protein
MLPIGSDKRLWLNQSTLDRGRPRERPTLRAQSPDPTEREIIVNGLTAIKGCRGSASTRVLSKP